jgi:hypothetical protein
VTSNKNHAAIKNYVSPNFAAKTDEDFLELRTSQVAKFLGFTANYTPSRQNPALN